MAVSKHQKANMHAKTNSMLPTAMNSSLPLRAIAMLGSAAVVSVELRTGGDGKSVIHDGSSSMGYGS